MTIEELKNDFLTKRELAKQAEREFHEAMVAAYPIKCGDTVECNQYGKTVISKVTKVTIAEHNWSGDEPKFEVRMTAYPLKKDGQVAKVGEIGYYDLRDVKVIQKAAL